MLGHYSPIALYRAVNEVSGRQYTTGTTIPSIMGALIHVGSKMYDTMWQHRSNNFRLGCSVP